MNKEAEAAFPGKIVNAIFAGVVHDLLSHKDYRNASTVLDFIQDLQGQPAIVKSFYEHFMKWVNVRVKGEISE